MQMFNEEELHRKYDKAASAVNNPATKLLIQELADAHEAAVRGLQNFAAEEACCHIDRFELRQGSCLLLRSRPCALVRRSQECIDARLEWATRADVLDKLQLADEERKVHDEGNWPQYYALVPGCPTALLCFDLMTLIDSVAAKHGTAVVADYFVSGSEDSPTRCIGRF